MAVFSSLLMEMESSRLAQILELIMEFVHMSTAYILRWNKPDYKEIIGVFLLLEHAEKFLESHFTPDEAMRTYMNNEPMMIETGRYYKPKR